MKFCWVEEKQSFTSKPESLQHFPVGQLASLQVSTIFRTIPDKSPGKTKNSEWCELRPGWSDRVRNDLQISSILFNYVQLYNHIISNTYYEYHIMRYKLTTTEKLTPGSGPAALPVTPPLVPPSGWTPEIGSSGLLLHVGDPQRYLQSHNGWGVVSKHDVDITYTYIMIYYVWIYNRSLFENSINLQFYPSLGRPWILSALAVHRVAKREQ